MAHMIDTMAYTGETPWHGLGVDMPSDASLDQWRINAGLTWNAIKTPELYHHNGELQQSEDFILIRNDNGKKLGNCSSRYQPVQPDTVVEFYRDLCSDYKFTIETMGSLDEGKRIWALAKTPEAFTIKGQDRVDSYLLLATSYDGTMATRAMFTSVRVVCHNTLTYVNRSAKGAISVPHSTSFDHNAVKIDLGIHHEQFTQFEANASKLSEITVGKQQALDFIFNLLKEKENTLEECSTRKANIIGEVLSLYSGNGLGASLRSANGTAWGLVNAVTQYVDHSQGNNPNNRFKSAQFGKGAELKEKAFNMALAIAA